MTILCFNTIRIFFHLQEVCEIIEKYSLDYASTGTVLTEITAN